MPKDIRLRITNFVGRNTNIQHALHVNLQRQLEETKSGFTVERLFDPLLTGGGPASVLAEAQQIRCSEAYTNMSSTERFYGHGLLYMGWTERPTVPGAEEPNRFVYRGFSTELYTKLVLTLELQHELAQTLVISLAGVLEETKCIENIAVTIEKVLQTLQDKETFDILWDTLSNSLLKEGSPKRIKDVLIGQKHRFYNDFSLETNNTGCDDCFQEFQVDENNKKDLFSILNCNADNLEILCEITDKGVPDVLSAYQECNGADFLYIAATKSNKALLEFISSTKECNNDLDKWMTRILSLSKYIEETDDLMFVTKTFAEKVLPYLCTCEENQNIKPDHTDGLKEVFLKLFHRLSNHERSLLLHFTREKKINFSTDNYSSEVSLFNRVFEGCTKDDFFVYELQKASLSMPSNILYRTLQMASEDKTKVNLALSFLQLLGYDGTDYAADALIDSAMKPSGTLLGALIDSNFGTIKHTIPQILEKQGWNDLSRFEFLRSFLQCLKSSFQEEDFNIIVKLVDKIMEYMVIPCELRLKLEACELLEVISKKSPDLIIEVKNNETYIEWKKEQILENFFHTEYTYPPPTKQQKKDDSAEPKPISFPCWLIKQDDERGPLKTKNMNQFEKVFEFVDACTLSGKLAETLPERLNTLRGVPPVPLIIATGAFRRNILLASGCILSRATDKEFDRFTNISLPKLISSELYSPEQFDGVSEAFIADCVVFQALWLLCTPAVVSQLTAKYFLEFDFFPCITNLIKHFSRRLIRHAQDDFVSALRLASSLYTIPLFRDNDQKVMRMRTNNEEQIRILCLNVIKAAHDQGGDEIKREDLKDIIQKTIPDELCKQELEAAIDKN